MFLSLLYFEIICQLEIFELYQPLVVQLISESIPDVNKLDHYDWVGHKKLLDERGCLYLWMSHQKNNHHLQLVYEGKEIEHFLNLVQNCIEDPVRGPVVEFSIIGLFPSEFGKKEQGLIGRI